MEYEIEAGHALKAKEYGTKYPWKDCAIGDSFFVPDKDGKRTCVSACIVNQRKHGRFFRVRRDKKNGVNGVRVYRVEPPSDNEE